MTDPVSILAVPTLAWIPFASPMPPPGAWWWLLALPLLIAISMIWKAVRLESLDRYWPQVFGMAAQLFLGMAGLTVALLLLVRFVIPLLPVE